MWEIAAYEAGTTIFSCRFHPDDLELETVWKALGVAIYNRAQVPYGLRILIVSPHTQLTG